MVPDNLPSPKSSFFCVQGKHFFVMLCTQQKHELLSSFLRWDRGGLGQCTYTKFHSRFMCGSVNFYMIKWARRMLESDVVYEADSVEKAGRRRRKSPVCERWTLALLCFRNCATHIPNSIYAIDWLSEIFIDFNV